MTTRTRTRSRQGRIRILAALGVASLALVVASPANAIYRDYDAPSDEAPVIERTMAQDDTGAKKGCTITLQKPDGSPGQSVVYDHGYSFSVINGATGKTHTYTCNNGKWEETVSSTVPTRNWDHYYEADNAYVNGTGELAIVNPHEEHAYSTGGGYYAQP